MCSGYSTAESTQQVAVSTAYNDTPAGDPRPFAAVNVNPKLDSKLFAPPE